MINGQEYQRPMQEDRQRQLPYSPNNGNPRGASNMPQLGGGSELSSLYNRIMPQQNPNYFGGQQNGVGRYRPPTMNGPGGGWQDQGPYNYNLPNAFGSYPGYSQGNPNGMRGGPGLGQMFPQQQNNQAQMFMEYLRQMMGPGRVNQQQPNMGAGGTGGFQGGDDGMSYAGGNPYWLQMQEQLRQQMNNPGVYGGGGHNAAMPLPASGRGNMFDGLRQYMGRNPGFVNNKTPMPDRQAMGGKGVAPQANPNFNPRDILGTGGVQAPPRQTPPREVPRRGG